MLRKCIGLLTVLCVLLSGCAALADTELLPSDEVLQGLATEEPQMIATEMTQITATQEPQVATTQVPQIAATQEMQGAAAAERLQIGNVALTINNNTYQLDPVVNLTSYADENNGYAGFSVGLANEEILPLAFGYDANGFIISLGDATHAYHISNDQLKALFGNDMEGELSVSGVTMIERYQKLFSAMDKLGTANTDPSLGIEMLRELLVNGTGNSSQAKVSINGASITGEHWDVRMDMPALISAYDQWMADAENPVSEYLRAMLDVMNGAMSTNYTSFAEVFADTQDVGGANYAMQFVGDLAQQGELVYVDFEITMPEQSDFNFEPMQLYMCGDAAGMSGKYTFSLTASDVRLAAESNFTSDETGVVSRTLLNCGDERAQFDLDATINADSFEVMMHDYTMDMRFNIHSDYANDVDEAEVDPYIYGSTNDISLNMFMDYNDGITMDSAMPLKIVTASVNFTSDDSYSYGYASTGLTENSSHANGNLQMAYGEQAGAGMSDILGQFNASASVDGLGSAGLSFTTTSSGAAAQGMFAGAQLYEMTDGQGTEAESMFNADMAKLETDVRKLIRDVSVENMLMGAFGTTADELEANLFPSTVTGTTDNGTGEMPGGTTDNGTGEMPGGTTDNGTAEMPGGTTDNGTAEMPGGTTDNGTVEMPGGTTDNGTVEMPGGTTDNGTVEMPGGMTDNGTGQASGETFAVSDMSEAAQYYNGIIPTYKAPAGYTTSDVQVGKDGSYLIAVYTNPNGDEFKVYLDNYSVRGNDKSYYTLNDSGKLEIQGGNPVTAFRDANGISHAYITGDNFTMTFYFANSISESRLADFMGGLR